VRSKATSGTGTPLKSRKGSELVEWFPNKIVNEEISVLRKWLFKPNPHTGIKDRPLG